MAFAFAVEELASDRSMDFASRNDALSITWSTSYRVTVTATGGDVAKDVDAYSVITASGLPKVNESVYYFAGEVIPFVICRNKKAKQDTKARHIWTVTCKYKSFDSNRSESDNAPQTPPAALSSLGTSEQPSLGEFEKVIYEDKTSGTAQKILLPSGAWFAEPVLERIPNLTVKLTQYESSITYEQMLDRKFKTNDATYRSQAAGKWLIEHVEASEVEVQLSGGATTAALVTYTLVHNPTDEGWKKSLALVDNQVLVGGKFEPYLDDSEPPQRRLVFVTSTGAKKSSQDTPDYIDFIVYDDTDFSSFLQA